jgi:hypothetical protein
MLILASNQDKLQIVTGSAGTLDVHASWMDNVSGAVQPGRTNTPNINTATTTNVVASPGAGTQRNIKTLHVRNRGAAANDIQVVHTDGTVAVQLHRQVMPPNSSLQYIDEVGFIFPPSSVVVMQKFVTAGAFTYVPNPRMVTAMIEMVGAGGGAGDAAAGPGNMLSGGGGGSGSYSRKIVTAADIGASMPGSIGAGGIPASGYFGGNGGPTWLGPTQAGAICLANGGGGGNGSLQGDQTPVGGAAGAVGIGDIVARGNPGEQGGYVLTYGATIISSGGRGASSLFGGGGPLAAVGGVGGAHGIDAGNYGSGGSGAISNQTGGFLGAGHGSPGACFITEFLR